MLTKGAVVCRHDAGFASDRRHDDVGERLSPIGSDPMKLALANGERNFSQCRTHLLNYRADARTGLHLARGRGHGPAQSDAAEPALYGRRRLRSIIHP
jgi:hypothetical protein